MQDETKRYQCRHIFTEGRRCGSPCLRHEELCYYHHTIRRPVENPRERRARQAHFDLPLPEDRASIQLSIGEVLRRIARNEIDPKRAGLLLYGLQIASLNLPRTTTTTANIAQVEEIVADPKLGTLAPRAEVAEPEKRQTLVGALLEIIEQDRGTRSCRSSPQSRRDRSQQSRTRTSILPTRNHRTRNNPAHSPPQHPGEEGY